MKVTRRLWWRASVLLGAVVAAALLAAPASAEEIGDLSQAMSQAVEKASPAVVRVLVPEVEPRPRRSRAPQTAPVSPKKTEEPAQPSGRTSDTQEPKGKDDKSETLPAQQPDKPPAQDTPDQPDKPSTDKPATSEGETKSSTEEETPEPTKPIKTTSRTGLIISADGYVITSLLNAGKAEDGIKVELSDGRVLPARRLGEDVRRDVVLLKVEGQGLPAIEPARQSDAAVGQWVLALGRTLPGSGPTVSKGIISAFGRMSGVALQTDANTSASNYGGPLVDLRGRGVGMIAALGSGGSSARAEQFSDSGIGFVVPLADILAELVTLKEGKRIEPAFLGIGYNWGRLGEGAQINRVIPGTAAAECGVKIGDIITEFDGAKVASAFQIGHLIGSHKVGDQVTFKVVRGEQTLTLSGTLKARPEYIRE